MEREEFRGVVRTLERRAKGWPRLYRLGVIARALFGYLFFYLLLIASVAALVGGVAMIVSDPATAFGALLMIAIGAYGLVFVVRALSFKLYPPTGVVVTRDDAPGLWQLVDSIRAKTGRPRVDQILLTGDLTAAVVQHPRRGLVFGSRHYLICGVPFMLGLTSPQFASVLTHELGHLAHRHGVVSSWAYRLNLVWQRVLEQTAHRPKHPLARFIRWYGPHFAAHSYVLRREQEFIADRAAADVWGVDACGDALILVYLRSAQDDEFWEQTWRRCGREAAPPVDVLYQLAKTFATLPDEATMRRELGASLARRTAEADSHPSLADRLDAMGFLTLRGVDIATLRGEPAEVAQRLPLPTFEPPSAAVSLFADRLDAIIDKVADAWAATISERWHHHHRRLLHDRGKLELLEQKAAAGTLTAAEAFDRLSIIDNLEGDARLPSLFDEARAIDPDFAPLIYLNGRYLLKKHEPAGVAFVERAMQLDPEAVGPGSQLLHDFHTRQNAHESAEEVIKRMDAHFKKVELARIERGLISTSDQVVPHDWPREDVRRVIGVLQTLDDVKAAYLVKRVLKHFPEKPAYALVVIARVPWRRWRTKKLTSLIATEIAGRLDLPLPPNTFVLGSGQGIDALRLHFARMPQHKIYERQGMP